MEKVGRVLKETGKILLIALGTMYAVDIAFDTVFEIVRHKKHKKQTTKINEKLQELLDEEAITKDELDSLNKFITKNKFGVEKSRELLLMEYCLDIVFLAQLRNKIKTMKKTEKSEQS